ncbi:aminoacyl-tRNA deacylase [uncultured Anaerococcus sp.]|uniref:aminoacyl-tRNA deacylase n=1 Tax=uncultured Anaerococcus sp. TaxID=293428 RepID=UPI0028893FFE|nr:aminoacyl-tRNA deacylase [uncultured Anaerococcus sp.]
MKKEIKTNAMRYLDTLNIEYEHIDYDLNHEFVSAVDLADEGHQDIHTIFKTLATESKEGDVYILVINGGDEIDFKKASKAIGVKSLSMLALKVLRKTVGYERGATTPLALKKDYPVYIDNKAKELDFIKVSAGKVGHSIKIKPDDLLRATKGTYADLIK